MQAPPVRRDRPVVIVGAGVVGMSIALWLQQRGRDVVVLDPRAPGTACSAGNSGGFGIGLVAPIAMPSLLPALPRMLLHPDEPLFLSARTLPRALPWFAAFLANARPGRVRTLSRHRAALNHAVRDTLLPLLDMAACRHLLREDGFLFVFRGASPSASAMQRFEIAAAHGIGYRLLSRTDLAAQLPGLSESVRSGVAIPANMHCTDPGGLVTAYARAAEDRGARILRQAVQAVTAGPDPSVRTEAGSIAASAVVIAAGVWSAGLVRELGYRVLLEAERGYHLMLPQPGLALPCPVTLADRNIVLTPMDQGLRITGVAEFASPEAPPRLARAYRLLRLAREYFPDIDGAGAVPWVGPRPSTPDSLPVIGPAPRHPGIYFAFGHGQAGLAHAGVTGRILADLMDGTPSPIDPAPYAITRFAANL